MTFENYPDSPLDNETAYTVLQNTTHHGGVWQPDSLFGPRYTLRSSLALGNYSVNGTVERGGRTFVQLSADGTAEDEESVTAYEGTVLVTSEGVVHGVEESFENIPYDREGPIEDANNTYVESSITLDTDVEWSGPPAWVGEVPQLSLSIVEDGQAVEIRNTGEEDLPANATFDVFGANETIQRASISRMPDDVTGTVTTDARLEPGEAVYVTAGADGSASSFALHDEPTRGEYTFGFAGLTGGPENVYYRLATGVEAPPWQNESSYLAEQAAQSLGPAILANS
ncbi:hypothetical protein [Halobacterium litoreum]|uniref:Uncharacterized protein n=1 Tax=Halobacterium litoreum TaxID=2039234 RepID=A0ABD5NDH7_9EURY|nr:hypothetical protein [Halobacterium litoreum]UHH14124.1 hypothetical protein LT972_03770 [Halobacterium litoreum]